jgi:hypothetical protein
MKTYIFKAKPVLFYIVLCSFVSCSEEPEYKDFTGGWVDVNYSIKQPNSNPANFRETGVPAVAIADTRLFVRCDGEGSRCEVGGPKDGVLLPAPVEIKLDNNNFSVSRKTNSIDLKAKLMNAYVAGNIVKEVINPANHVFDSIKDKDKVISNLISGTYKITELRSGQLVIYSGNILEANFLYILN